MFKVKAVDLGELRGIILYKTGSDDWKVSWVEIDCPQGEVVRFNVNDQPITAKGVKVKKCKFDSSPRAKA